MGCCHRLTAAVWVWRRLRCLLRLAAAVAPDAAIAARDQRNTAGQIKHLVHALALSIISTKR